MTERIAYDCGEGKIIDADVARWVMAIVETLEKENPGFRAKILQWLQDARTEPADPMKIAVIQGMIGKS
mgnify:CR=1 FL=1